MHRFLSPSRSIPLCVLLSFAPGGVLAAITPKEVHQVVPLDAKGELSLETFKGTVKATAWDRAEVKLDAVIQVDESSDCGSEQEKAEWVRKTEVKIESSPGSVRVRSDYDLLEAAGNLYDRCITRPFVNYDIRLPANARIRIADHKSAIQIADLRGAINLTTHKGKVDLRGIEGPLELTTHKGEVRVAFSKWAQASRITTHKGDIDVSLPKSSKFDLEAVVGRRGEFQSDFAGANLVSQGVYRGSVNGGGPSLRLTTHKGHFHLRQA